MSDGNSHKPIYKITDISFCHSKILENISYVESNLPGKVQKTKRIL